VETIALQCSHLRRKVAFLIGIFALRMALSIQQTHWIGGSVLLRRPDMAMTKIRSRLTRPALVALMIGVVSVVGCGGGAQKPLNGALPACMAVPTGGYKVGRPYRITGQVYVPREDFTYDRTGIASWYGPGYHGRPTATGERFDQWAFTAAHPTLQMPSLVEVTNLENGRSLILRLNDRGPFVDGRIIDVSRQAARALGFERRGIVRVRVRVLSAESRRLAEAAQRRDRQVCFRRPSRDPAA